MEEAYAWRWAPMVTGFILSSISFGYLAFRSIPYQDMDEEIYQQYLRKLNFATVLFFVCVCILVLGIVFFFIVTFKYKAPVEYLAYGDYRRHMLVPLLVSFLGYGLAAWLGWGGPRVIIGIAQVFVWPVYTLALTSRHAKSVGSMPWGFVLPCTLGYAGLTAAATWLSVLRSFNPVRQSDRLDMLLTMLLFKLPLPLLVVLVGLVLMRCLLGRRAKAPN